MREGEKERRREEGKERRRDGEMERWRDEVKNISARSAYFSHGNVICNIMSSADRSARKREKKSERISL